MSAADPPQAVRIPSHAERAAYAGELEEEVKAFEEASLLKSAMRRQDLRKGEAFFDRFRGEQDYAQATEAFPVQGFCFGARQLQQRPGGGKELLWLKNFLDAEADGGALRGMYGFPCGRDLARYGAFVVRLKDREGDEERVQKCWKTMEGLAEVLQEQLVEERHRAFRVSENVPLDEADHDAYAWILVRLLDLHKGGGVQAIDDAAADMLAAESAQVPFDHWTEGAQALAHHLHKWLKLGSSDDLEPADYVPVFRRVLYESRRLLYDFSQLRTAKRAARSDLTGYYATVKPDLPYAHPHLVDALLSRDPLHRMAVVALHLSRKYVQRDMSLEEAKQQVEKLRRTNPLALAQDDGLLFCADRRGKSRRLGAIMGLYRDARDTLEVHVKNEKRKQSREQGKKTRLQTQVVDPTGPSKRRRFTNQPLDRSNLGPALERDIAAYANLPSTEKGALERLERFHTFWGVVKAVAPQGLQEQALRGNAVDFNKDQMEALLRSYGLRAKPERSTREAVHRLVERAGLAPDRARAVAPLLYEAMISRAGDTASGSIERDLQRLDALSV